MFTTGAKVDLKRLEEEIRKEIEEKKNLYFTDDDLDELQKATLDIIPNPDRVRPFFYRQLELEFNKPDLKFYDSDYNIDLNTFVYSANSGFLMKLRGWFRPFFRLYGNIDALIHKQAIFNREQAEFNTSIVSRLEKSLEKGFHCIRTMHAVASYLVAELTRLNLQPQLLKAHVEALTSDLDQLRKRERLLEKSAVLKEPSKTESR
jgi:hypothetical protein